MSLWAEYGPRYGGVLILIAVLVMLVHFRKRREQRLASGWRLVAIQNKMTQNTNWLTTLLIGAFFGAWLTEWHHLTANTFAVLAFIILVITPRAKWVAPEITEPCR